MTAHTSLDPVLRARRPELVDQLVASLHSSTALHYRDRDLAPLRERCTRLVDAFLDSMGSGPAQLAAYLRSIARERIDEGVRLQELQLVLHLLESRCWRICDEQIADRHEVVAALGLVSGVIGHAKDALAQVYLELATTSRKDLRDLRRHQDELTRGTDTALYAE